jgi:dipeptidase E
VTLARLAGVPGDVLLLSNSRPPGGAEPFTHAREVLDAHLGGRTVWFLPYAQADHDAYFRWVDEALGVDLRPLHREPDPAATAAGADAVFVGGGNTFRLLHDVRRLGVLDALRANDACRYTGSSAGTNLAQPTIMTTCRSSTPAASTPCTACRSRSTRTTSTPTPRARTRARPARNGSGSSTS